MIQLLFLPGLGGDHRMAHAQLALPYRCITPDYIPFHLHESLAAYSKRYCEYLLSTGEIDLAQPLFVVGYSMGAAIAQEIGSGLPMRGLIMIGGPLTSNEIELIPRVFGRYSSGWLPIWYYRFSEFFIGPVMRIISDVSEEEVRLCVSMYHYLPRGLFREAYRTLAWWRCSPSEIGKPMEVPLIRIHGELDHIIRCPKPGNSVVIIGGAKHLVGQSQPAKVNDAIERFISATMSES